MTNGTEKESHSVSILPYEFYNYSEFGNWEWQKQKTELKGIIQLSEKYKENFDVWSEGPSYYFEGVSYYWHYKPTLSLTVQENKITYIFVPIKSRQYTHAPF